MFKVICCLFVVMTTEKVNLTEKLSQFSDHWNPRVVGELNGQHVKLAKLKGEFVWHKHDNEDELFFVIKGKLAIELRDKTIKLEEGEFCIIPKGVEHKPIAENEVEIMLFEPAATLNTGDKRESDFTKETLDKI